MYMLFDHVYARPRRNPTWYWTSAQLLPERTSSDQSAGTQQKDQEEDSLYVYIYCALSL